MANFHGHQIPQAGRNLMAKLIATGRPLAYSSVKVGDGVLGGRLVSGLTELIGLKKSFPIFATPVRSGDGRWNVTAIFNNAGIDQDFWWRHWGIFAADPDTGQEVLVAYANAGDTADYIHAWTGSDDSSYVEEQITCACVVSSELTVEAVLDKSQLFAPLEAFEAHQEEFEGHLNHKGNPHEVTPEQIGAAKTGHTHPPAEAGAAAANHTHAPADIGAAPASHTHTAAQVGASPSNHSHTAAQVGAAPASHAHAAGQITAGTLVTGVLASYGTDYGTSRLRNIRAGTGDLTPGVSALNNGEIYLVYE